MILGLGLIIFALQWISAAAKPFVQAAGVKVIFASLTGDVLLDMLVAALFTILCYSSLAVVLLMATLASLVDDLAAGGAAASCSAPTSAAACSACCRRCASPPEARRVHARQLPVQG